MAKYDGPWGDLPDSPAPPPSGWRQDRRIRLVIALAVGGLLGVGVWGLTQLFPGRLVSRNDWSTVAYQGGFVILIALSLFSRRLKLGEVARYAAIWAVVFAVLALGFTFRGEITRTATRVRSELFPSSAIPAGDHQLVLSQDADGNYSVDGQVNGRPVQFVIDTGASDVVLTPADAARLGIDVASLDYARKFETANGVGAGAGYTAQSLSVGPISLYKVSMSINRAPMSKSLLGQSFLKRLDSYQVKDGRMYLKWRG